MQFCNSKVVATEIKPRRNNLPVLLLTGKLLLSVVPISLLAISCVTTRDHIVNTHASSIFYFDTENYMYEYFQTLFGDLWGGKNFIIEINESVPRLAELLGANAISFTTVNMPLDVLNLLRSCGPEDDSYEDFYDYVVQNVDRIILCPQIKGASGFAMSVYRDFWPYQSESLVFLDMHKIRFFSSSSKAKVIAAFLVHEAGHKEILRLMSEGVLPPKYIEVDIQERHALAREMDFRRKINRPDSWTSARLGELNRQYGRPRNDRTGFILEN